MTLELHSWFAPSQALALVANPRLGLQHHYMCECNDNVHRVFVHVIDLLVLNLEILKLFLLKLDALCIYLHIWVWVLSMDATMNFVLLLVVSTVYLFLEEPYICV